MTTYFPNQPVRLTFSADAQRERVEVTVSPAKGLIKATASYNEFIRAMSEAGQTFFSCCMKIAPNDQKLYENLTLKLRGVVATLEK